MPFLEGLAPILEETHPARDLGVNQTFTLEENDYFFNYLAQARTTWRGWCTVLG